MDRHPRDHCSVHGDRGTGPVQRRPLPGRRRRHRWQRVRAALAGQDHPSRDQWRSILQRFGATINYHPDPANPQTGTLTVTGSAQRGSDGSPVFPGGGTIADASELAPTIAAIAALADSPTT